MLTSHSEDFELNSWEGMKYTSWEGMKNGEISLITNMNCANIIRSFKAMANLTQFGTFALFILCKAMSRLSHKGEFIHINILLK